MKRIQEPSPLHDRIVELVRHADLGVTNARVIDERPPDEKIEKMYAIMPAEVRERLIKDKERWLKPELAHRGSGGVDFRFRRATVVGNFGLQVD